MLGRWKRRKRQDRTEYGQREDPTLKRAWDLASKNQRIMGSGSRLILRDGVLYRIEVDPMTQEEINQLVLPRGKRKRSTWLTSAL